MYSVDWTVANNVFAYEQNRTGIVGVDVDDEYATDPSGAKRTRCGAWDVGAYVHP